MGTGATPEGAGTVPDGGAVEGADAGAGADAGSGGDKDGQTGAGDVATTAAGVEALDRAKLHPILAGMSEEGMNDLFETLTTAVRSGGVKPSAEEPVVTAPEPPKPATADEVKDAFDVNSDAFNPVAMITKTIEQNYGPLIEGLATRGMHGLHSSMQDQFPDYSDFKDEVTAELNKIPPTQVTDQLVLNVYLRQKGLRQAQKERKERADTAGTATLTPSVPEVPVKKALELDELQKTVARQMFRGSADPEKDYLEYWEKEEAGDTVVKVPLGGGKFA